MIEVGHLDPDAVASRFESNPYLLDPCGWAEHVLDEYMWRAQEEICDSVVVNRHTAVRSAHGTGKSYTASRLAAWWLDVHPVGSAFVVTTAPTQPQVNAILWREIRITHRKGSLDGRVTLDCHWYMGEDELVAFGRKPADYTDEDKARAAFQGVHARYILIILDEAGGIPPWLWEAVESLATNEDARILAIGNPDDPTTDFAKVSQPGSGWHQIQISAFDIPTLSDDPEYAWGRVPEHKREYLSQMLTGPTWVEERKRRWGEESPLYISKVLGEFPEVADDVLITPKMIREAILRELSGIEKGIGGVDISRKGGDETVAYRNRGGVMRRQWQHRMRDTAQTTGSIRKWMDKLKGEVPVWIDMVGLGAGPFDALRADGYPVHGFNGAERAYDPQRFKNRRAEQYWALRELFDDGLIDLDPEDEDLHAQLGSIKWKLDTAGRVQIEAKEDIIKRLGVSPDRADTVMMATCTGAAMPRNLAELHKSEIRGQHSEKRILEEQW